MNARQKELIQAASVLGLTYIIPYTVNLGGIILTVDALFPQFGVDTDGLLICGDQYLARDILKAGKNFSATSYGEPSDRDKFDLLSYIELFSDFGWNGLVTETPEWVIPYDVMDQYLEDRRHYISLYLEGRWKKYKDQILLGDW